MVQLKHIEKALDVGIHEDSLNNLDDLCDEYLKAHPSVNMQASIRVHEMLCKIWKSDALHEEAHQEATASEVDVKDCELARKLLAKPSKKAVFLHVLNRLSGCLTKQDQFDFWYHEVSVYAIDSSGHHVDIVNLSQQFITSVLTGSIQYCDAVGPKLSGTFSENFARHVLALYVSDKLPENSQGTLTDERVRIVKQNCRMLFGRFARAETVSAFAMINEYFVYSRYRLDILSFVVEYFAESQNSKLFRVFGTPFFESLLKSLERDYARPCVQLGLTSLAMVIVHICDKLADVMLLCRIFAILGRACSWQTVMPSLQTELQKHCSDWELVQDDDVDHEETLNVTPLFTFLYALFPINTLQFCRHCDEYLNKHNFTKDFDDFWSRFMVTKKASEVVRHFTVDPLMLTLGEETELTKCVQRFRELGSTLEISSIASSRYVHESVADVIGNLDAELEERKKVFQMSTDTSAAHWHRELLLMRNELAFANFTIAMSEHRALLWQKRASNFTVVASQNDELNRKSRVLQKKVAILEEEAQRATRSARTIMRERSAYESKLVNKNKETRESILVVQNLLLQLENEKTMLVIAEKQAREQTIEEQKKLTVAELELKAVESGIIRTTDGVTIVPLSKAARSDSSIEEEILKNRHLQQQIEKQSYRIKVMEKEHAGVVKRLKDEIKQSQDKLSEYLRKNAGNQGREDTMLTESGETKLLGLLTRMRERNDALSGKCAQLERDLRARKIYEEERLNELQIALTSTKFFGPQDVIPENKFRGRGGAQGTPRRTG